MEYVRIYLHVFIDVNRLVLFMFLHDMLQSRQLHLLQVLSHAYWFPKTFMLKPCVPRLALSKHAWNIAGPGLGLFCLPGPVPGWDPRGPGLRLFCRRNPVFGIDLAGRGLRLSCRRNHVLGMDLASPGLRLFCRPGPVPGWDLRGPGLHLFCCFCRSAAFM